MNFKKNLVLQWATFLLLARSISASQNTTLSLTSVVAQSLKENSTSGRANTRPHSCTLRYWDNTRCSGNPDETQRYTGLKCSPYCTQPSCKGYYYEWDGETTAWYHTFADKYCRTPLVLEYRTYVTKKCVGVSSPSSSIKALRMDCAYMSVFYYWSTGDWRTCESTCTQTRLVACRRSDGEYVNVSFCNGTKPATTQKCSDGNCVQSNAMTSSVLSRSGSLNQTLNIIWLLCTAYVLRVCRLPALDSIISARL